MFDDTYASSVDFGTTAADYHAHRKGFGPEVFARLEREEILQKRADILDLGCGTGSLAIGFAARGHRVTALDPSQPMLQVVAQRAMTRGVRVSLVRGKARDTRQASASMDVVTAGQCWHWFDRAAAAQEARRVLRLGGWLVLAHLDWLTLPDNVVEATLDLIEEHNPERPNVGRTWASELEMFVPWTSDLRDAGFTNMHTFIRDESLRYTHEGWRGRIRASSCVGASLNAERVARFDRAHADMLAERFPQDPMEVAHRVTMICAQKTKQ